MATKTTETRVVASVDAIAASTKDPPTETAAIHERDPGELTDALNGRKTPVFAIRTIEPIHGAEGDLRGIGCTEENRRDDDGLVGPRTERLRDEDYGDECRESDDSADQKQAIPDRVRVAQRLALSPFHLDHQLVVEEQIEAELEQGDHRRQGDAGRPGFERRNLPAPQQQCGQEETVEESARDDEHLPELFEDESTGVARLGRSDGHGLGESTSVLLSLQRVSIAPRGFTSSGVINR